MDDSFRGRVAVVTGGASGIGAALARGLAVRGAAVALADLDEAALADAAARLEAGGATVLTVPTDVTRRDAVEALAEAVMKRFGAVHLVCNNAGVAIAGALAGATPEDWRYVMDVNFWGVVHGVDAFVPRLLAQGQRGHILNTASMAGLVGMQGLGIYCASKFAVVGLSEALHRELRPHGIGVSVLCPMIVATNITANSARRRPGAGRPGEPGGTPVEAGPAMQGGIVDADAVARRCLEAIERGDLYILTHAAQREILRRRAQRLEAACVDGDVG